MNLQPMSFRGFVWPHNPSSLTVEYAREIKTLKQPYEGSILQDYGSQKRIVSGKGEFTGKNSMTEFNRLSSVFSQKGGGTLTLPGSAPFAALFESLKMIGEAQPELVKYSFVFIENEGIPVPLHVGDEKIYLCSGGESLWGIAGEDKTTVDVLMPLNPQIQWPNYLEAGTRVVLG